MFLVNDTIAERHEQIRALDPFIGVILAAADFEWTVRRAILALGTRPTKNIREEVLRRAFGLDGYKQAWKEEVYPRTGKHLAEIIRDWKFFSTDAYRLRNRLVHGIKGAVGDEYARERLESILEASRTLNDFAEAQGAPLYGRPIRRLKSRREKSTSADSQQSGR